RRVTHADAIVVLGAAQYNGTPTPVFAGRLKQAELLFREHRAPEVIVLGGNEPGDITTEGTAGRNYLIEQGVPPVDVVSEPEGNDTYESLRAAANYMKAHDMHSAFLVSDPWHNLRIKKMASDLGIGYPPVRLRSGDVRISRLPDLRRALTPELSVPGASVWPGRE